MWRHWNGMLLDLLTVILTGGPVTDIIYFNSSMDRMASEVCTGFTYLLRLERLHSWSFVMDKWLNHILYNGCIFWFRIINVSTTGPRLNQIVASYHRPQSVPHRESLMRNFVQPAKRTLVSECRCIINWDVLCWKQVSRPGIGNYIPQIPGDVITWLWYLLLTQCSSIMRL